MELLQSGDKKGAMECFQRAVDVTPRMAFNLIELLRKENVEFMVAPFEADPQLTYLCLNGLVDAVISEDSDLIPFGCPRMLYKLDKDGNGKEIQFRDLGLVKDLDLSRFSAEMFRHMCILSGCDYLESLPGMGLKKAHNLLQRHGTMGEIFKALEGSKTVVPEGYALDFGRADLTFQHQIVYDPRSRRTVHLHPLPDDVDPSTLPFTGHHLDDAVAQLIADGRIDPHTYEPFILSIPTAIPNSNSIYHPPGSQMSSSNISRNSSQAPALSDSAYIQNGGTQPMSQTTASTPTRLSTQWQNRTTTPLSALRQPLTSSSGSRASPSLSSAEIAKHDNDMTRDVVRYTMFRGSGKGVRNASATGSNIISSSVQLKPTNTLHSYFSTTPSKLSSSQSLQASTPTRAAPLNNFVASPSSTASPTVLRSRFFSTQPSEPSSPYSVAASPVAKPVDLESYSALLDDEFELDEATEAMLAQAERFSAQKKVVPTPTTTPQAANLTSPKPALKAAPVSSPSRFTLPSKVISISIDEDEEELELIPMQLENKLNAGRSFSLAPVTPAKASVVRPSVPLPSVTITETAVVERLDTNGANSLTMSSSSLVLSSSTGIDAALFEDLVPMIVSQPRPSSTNAPQYSASTSRVSPPSNTKKRAREDFEVAELPISPPSKIKVMEMNEISIFNLLD